jgi:hypothetical protein
MIFCFDIVVDNDVKYYITTFTPPLSISNFCMLFKLMHFKAHKN